MTGHIKFNRNGHENQNYFVVFIVYWFFKHTSSIPLVINFPEVFWVVWDLFCFPFLLFYWGTWYPKKTKDSRRGCLHELRDTIESIENKLPSEILCAWVLVSASKVLEQSWFEIEFAHDRERWTSNEDTIDVAADYNFNRKKRRYKRVKRAHTRAIPFLWFL